MKKLVLAAVGAALVITGCSSLKDAMSAHVDTVAKAADQELTISRLATLMGKSKAPLRKDVANAVVDAWTNYQLAGLGSENPILKRFNVGGAFRWSAPLAIDYYGAQNLPAVITSLDPNKPIYQKAQYHIDAFIGYRTKLFADRIPARFQLNMIFI